MITHKVIARSPSEGFCRALFYLEAPPGHQHLGLQQWHTYTSRSWRVSLADAHLDAKNRNGGKQLCGRGKSHTDQYQQRAVKPAGHQVHDLDALLLNTKSHQNNHHKNRSCLRPNLLGCCNKTYLKTDKNCAEQAAMRAENRKEAQKAIDLESKSSQSCLLMDARSYEIYSNLSSNILSACFSGPQDA